jgi:hypothetical protein
LPERPHTMHLRGHAKCQAEARTCVCDALDLLGVTLCKEDVHQRLVCVQVGCCGKALALLRTHNLRKHARFTQEGRNFVRMRQGLMRV